MGIIIGIRKLLRLDNKTFEFDSDVIDASGLIIPELKYFMTKPCDGCFCSSDYLLPPKHSTDFHLSAGFHHIQDLHL